MRAKKTVSAKSASFEIGYAIGIAESVYSEVGSVLVVTSLNDSKHSSGSLHYTGRAVDLRTKHLQPGVLQGIRRDTVPAVFAKLRERLEPLGFDVVLESDHIHVEFDPKAGESVFAIVE